MEKTTTQKSSAVIYGVLFGAIMILELVISFVMNINPAENKSFGIVINTLNFLVLPLAFIYFAANDFKIKVNLGFISLSKVLKIGVSLCVIAALVYGIFSAIFNLMFPEFVAEILKNTKAAMLQQNPDMPKEQMEMALSWTEKFMNPIFAIPFIIVMYAFIGLIYSLIIGLIIKKDPK